MIKKYVCLIDVDQVTDEVNLDFSADPSNHDLLCIAEHILYDVNDDIGTKIGFRKFRDNV